MSDHTPDPIDKAYAQAQAVLDDEAARAARRTRVLGAVARDAEAPLAAARSKPRSASRRHGGWLAAASVAGVSVLIALQINPPPDRRPPPPATQSPTAPSPTPAPAPAPAPSIAKPPPPEARSAAAAPSPAPVPAIAAEAAMRAPREAAAPASPPSPSSEAASAPPPPPPAVAAPPSPATAADRVEELVVTGSRLETQRPAAQSASAAMKVSPAVRAENLRAAAAAGRVAELRTLLAQGALVDAADDDGETALMKAIQSNQPAAAALLRRRGASLDLKNHAGASARDMATAIGDADLDRALGLAP